MTQIVTRFAPSPTGFLHIGGARTALFSWLLARHHQGRFLLRIEDTDVKRSTPEAIQAILDAMHWLGMDWDGEAVFQSRRRDRHNQVVDQLLEKGVAYRCRCTPDAVEAMRAKARAEGRKPKYDMTCREKCLEPGPDTVVRFKTPVSGHTGFTDLVKGPIAVDNSELDDMILRRSDGSPTYNLAVVVDDHDMGVTHVLRGDDHTNNTPRQQLLYQALGWDVPAFGHVPMILGPDKKKLSKRHGALAVMEYEKMGYLPDAMVNYLARLGWSSGDQELFSRSELVARFSLDNLNSSAAVFDLEKLNWVNSHHIKETPSRELAPLLNSYLVRADLPPGDVDYLENVIPLLKPRAKTMVDMAAMASFFVLEDADLTYDPKLIGKFFTPEVREHLEELSNRLSGLEEFSQAGLEAAVKGYLEDTGLTFKVLAQPLRVALTARTASPGIFEMMEILGRERTLNRIGRALQQAA